MAGPTKPTSLHRRRRHFDPAKEIFRAASVRLERVIMDAPEPAAVAPKQEDDSPRRLLMPRELAGLLAVSHKTLDRLRAAGKIGPSVIRLSSQVLRWDVDEVQAWFDHRDRRGQLYDAQQWPAVWSMLRRTGKAGSA